MNCEKDAIKRYLREQHIHAPLDDATLLRIAGSLSSANISTLDIPTLLGVSAETINRASPAAMAPWWQDAHLTPVKKKSPPSTALRNAGGGRQLSTTTATARAIRRSSGTGEPQSGGGTAKAAAAPAAQDIWSKYKIEERPWRKHMSTKPRQPSPEQDKSIWEKYNIEERPWKHQMAKTVRPPPQPKEVPDRASLRESRPRPWTRCMKSTKGSRPGGDDDVHSDDDGDGDDGYGESARDDDGSAAVAKAKARTAAADDELDRTTRREQRPRPWASNMKTTKVEAPTEEPPDRRSQREQRLRPWQSHMQKRPKQRSAKPQPDRKEPVSYTHLTLPTIYSV